MIFRFFSLIPGSFEFGKYSTAITSIDKLSVSNPMLILYLYTGCFDTKNEGKEVVVVGIQP